MAPGHALECLGREVDGGCEAEPAADLAAGGMVGERREDVDQLALELASARDQVLALEDVEVRERGRATGRMAGVGRSVAEHRAARLGPERLGDRAADEHGAERQVAARDALGEHDHVGLDVPALVSEPGADAAERADHAVDHEQDAVALADRRDRLDIARGRRAHAARADHRLAEEGRDVRGPDALDLGLERLGRLVVDVRDRAEQRAVALAHGLDADEARAEAVRAVVGERAADQVDALRLPLRRPVLARELGRRVDRVAAAEAQEDARIRIGESCTSRSTSSSAGALATSPNVWKASSVRSCCAIASAMSSRPWPMWACHRLAVPSR